MALKSYSFMSKRKERKKSKGRSGKFSDVGSLVIGGTTAILGIGLLGATSAAVARV